MAPEAAARVWLLKLSAGEEIGLSRVLARPRHDELLRQWRNYRAEMNSSRRPPQKIETVVPRSQAPVTEELSENRQSIDTATSEIWPT
ncbi:hypothetical protein [Micromonospora sp. CA-244673]|uniref:hypothetical protein n=1 Tax=Micromonospora sp. CA-244673 TaxID=3239958 RepID=UPI003D907435